MAEIKYDVIEEIAVLSENGDWRKELKLISWNDRPAKYDLRDWNVVNGRMTKGITFTEEEAAELLQALKNRFE